MELLKICSPGVGKSGLLPVFVQPRVKNGFYVANGKKQNSISWHRKII